MAKSRNDKLAAAADQKQLQYRRHPTTAWRIPLFVRLAERKPSESAGSANVCAGSRFLSFFGSGDNIHDSMCLSHWIGPASWLVVHIASIGVRRIDEPHDFHDNDLANRESQPSASGAEVAVFL